MRIVAGKLRSRTFGAPAGMATRPTSDRLRETLFNVLAPRIEGAAFLDLYAGSGGVGLEALSRGAATVEFVEQAPAAVKALKANLERLGLVSGFRIHAASAVQAMERLRGSFNLVFLDPPYDLDREYAATLGALGGPWRKLLAEDAIVVAEHRRKDALPARFAGLVRYRLLEQGDAALSFYSLESAREAYAAFRGL